MTNLIHIKKLWNIFFSIPKNVIFFQWFILSLLLRVIASFTHNSWQHPDDWFQTLEYAQFFSQGIMSYSQEVALHMRNLTWPFILSLPLRCAYAIDPQSVFLRLFFVQLFTSLFSLSILFFWKIKLDHYFPKNLLTKTQTVILHFSYFLVVGAWFFYSDFIHPSQENISISLFFLSLYLFEKKHFFYAGFFALGCGLVRYPNGLLSLGLILSIFLITLKNKNWNNFYFCITGSLSAVIFFGISDYFVYGRPYESFWMYFHYNVVYSLGAAHFGEQSAFEYWVFLKGHFFRFFSVLYIPFFVFAVLGVVRGVYKVQPWAWAFIFYLIPHLFIGHKEGRFMRPLEFLFLWSFLECFFVYKDAFKKNFNQFLGVPPKKINNKLLVFIALIVFHQNFIFLVSALWGSSFKTLSSYLNVDSLLSKYNDICAVVSVRLPASVLVPHFDQNHMPKPSYLFFYASDDQSLEYQLKSKPLYEAQEKSKCLKNEKILFHFHRTDPYFENRGCELINSGILRIIPGSLQKDLVEKGKIKGPWYLCPHELLEEFQKREVRKSFISKIDYISWEDITNLTYDKMMEIKKKFEEKYNLRVMH